MKYPNFEQITNILPATFNELLEHFISDLPNISPRGFRNLLNKLVNDKQLFIVGKRINKRGTPEIIYGVESPINLGNDKTYLELLKLQNKFSSALIDYQSDKRREKLISVYQKLGEILLSNRI